LLLDVDISFVETRFGENRVRILYI